MNDRNFYERRLGNPGYDAVARKKIKELEKAVFGGTELVEKVLYQTDNAEFEAAGEGRYSLRLNGFAGVTVGKTYKVQLDGASYECVGDDSGGAPTIGNPAKFMPTAPDTGEPFIIISMGGWMIATSTPFTSVKISVLEEQSVGGSGGGANVITYTVQLADDFSSSASCDKTFEEVKNLLLNHTGNNVQTIVKVVSAYDLVIDTAMIHMNGYNEASEVDISFKYLFTEGKIYHSSYDGEENISVEGLDVSPV